MKRREKLLAIGAAVAIGLLIADAYVLRPIAAAYAELDDRRVAAMDELQESRNLQRRRRAAQQRWREMVNAGLTSSSADAESQALHAMRTWGITAGLNLASMQPERRAAPSATAGAASDKQRERLREIDIAVRGTGPLESIARLFYEIETAEQPVRIRSIRISRAGRDEQSLALEMRASTVYREHLEADE